MSENVFRSLIFNKNKNGAGFFILIDPDKTPAEKLPLVVDAASNSGVDALLVGGSLLLTPDYDGYIKSIKSFNDNIPVILFPGGPHQISAHADALLFLSLLSGRNAQNIIGTQVLAAPIIQRLKIEPISTAYLLVESGKTTAAQFMSNTVPLPRHKPEIAYAHALAAQYMGFKFIYLEGGSGAEHSVPLEMISLISKHISTPLIVGGGIRTPKQAADKVAAGASFIVTGNVLEGKVDSVLIKEFVAAVHQS